MLQNEDVSMKTVQITTKNVTKLLRLIAKGGVKFFNKLRQIYKISKTRGEQSYSNLYRSGQSLSSVDISGNKELTAFKEIANKWGMDFSVKKDESDKGNYHVFFKAKDQDVFDKVFSEYDNYLKNRKPSLLEKLEHKKEEIAQKKQLEAEKQKMPELEKPKEQLPELNKGDSGMTL